MPPPLEVCQMGWCWGAFGLSWIWGIGNRVWLSFLCMVPYVGPIFGIWLAIAGHKLAWQNRRFESFQQYRDTMRVWNTWGLAIFMISLLPILAGIFLPVFSGARMKAVQQSCISNEKQIALAMLQYCEDWNETLPASSTWQGAVMEYIKSDWVLECPSGGGYGYNKNLNMFPLMKIREPNKTGVLYEVDQAGEEWYPHREGMNVGFVDGHCKWATEDEVKTMVW
jgi:prepilin-type processing-associated H-X9-DG protein